MKYNIVIVNIILLLTLIIGNIYAEYIYSFNALVSGHRVYFNENFDYDDLQNLSELGLSFYTMEQDEATGNKSTIIYYESLDSSISEYDCVSTIENYCTNQKQLEQFYYMNDVTFINGISPHYAFETMFYVEAEEQNIDAINNYLASNELGVINWEQQERNVYPFISTVINIFVLVFTMVILAITLVMRILDVSKKNTKKIYISKMHGVKCRTYQRNNTQIFSFIKTWLLVIAIISLLSIIYVDEPLKYEFYFILILTMILTIITILCYLLEFIIILIIYRIRLVTKGKIPFNVVSKGFLVVFIIFSTIMLYQILLGFSDNNYSFKQGRQFKDEYSQYYTLTNGVRSTDSQIGEANAQELINDIEEANGLYYADFYFLNEGYGIDENKVQIIYVNENFMHEIGVKGEIKPNDVFILDTFEYKSEIEKYIANENASLTIKYINSEEIDDDFPKQRDNYIYVVVDPHTVEVEQLALLTDYYVAEDLNQILIENNMEGISTITTVEQKVNIYLGERTVDIIIFITSTIILILTYIIFFNHYMTSLLARKKRYIFVAKISGQSLYKVLNRYIIYIVPITIFILIFPKYLIAFLVLVIISAIIIVVKYMEVWHSIDLNSENERELS